LRFRIHLFVPCTMKVLLSFAPVAFASISVTQPQLFDAAHMKETFKGIASQGGKIDDATKANIQSIVDLIKGNVTVALGVDYGLVIKEFEAAEADLRKVNTDFQTCKSTSYARQEAGHVADHFKHVSCRNYEHTTCFEEETDCGSHDDNVKNLGATFPAFPGVDHDDDCAGPNGAIYTWMEGALAAAKRFGPGCKDDDTGAACYNRVTTHATLGLKGCNADTRHASCSEYLNGTHCDCCDYASCRANCLTRKENHIAETALCDRIQSDMESEYCEARSVGCWCCDGFFNDWNRERGELATADSHAQTQIDLINAQQTALECLLCYGEQILTAGTPDFAECDMAGCVGCSAYVYPTSSIDPDHTTTAGCKTDIFGNLVLDFGFSPDPVLSSTCVKTVSATSECTECAAYPDQTAATYHAPAAP